jgi:hypothetical protein
MKTLTVFKKVAGKIKDDGTFFTYRTEKHYFRKYKGFGLSWSVIEQLRKHKVTKIVILYNKDNGITKKLETTLETWLKHSQIYNNCSNDWQRILNLKYFKNGICKKTAANNNKPKQSSLM